MHFSHLLKINQTYFDHLIDALSFSVISAKACFYFFIHGIYPDIFEFNGSDEIKKLNEILIQKKLKLVTH
jgi:hypothetical protein